jgi:uncharacterized protein (DUF3084 family)
MDQKLVSDSIASIRKALEEFLTPSFRELRTETHADTDQLRADVDKLRTDIAQLRTENTGVRSEAQQFRAETAANFAQVRDEAQQFRAETSENFAKVRDDVTGLRGEVNTLRSATEHGFSEMRSAMERGFFEIGAKLDLQADVHRLKEQVASLQASQQMRALETH